MGKDNKVHETGLGRFTETGERVFVADSVDQSVLVVPAGVAKTGRDQNLPVESDTVFYTNREAARVRQAFDKGDYSGLSTLASFTRAAEQAVLQSDPSGGVGIINAKVFGDSQYKSVVDSPHGAYAVKLGSSGGLIQLPSSSAEDCLQNFTATPFRHFNVPEAYIQAFKSFATAHELEHIEDTTPSLTLESEIKADFGSLRDHFNRDFSAFVLEMRALGSLNGLSKPVDASQDIYATHIWSEASKDDHATHIWSEEYGRSTPTAQETENIVAAPIKIYERTLAQVTTRFPEDEAIDQLNDVRFRYAAFKALRDNGSFNDIPFANEFVDKYTSAAEKWYKPESLGDVDGFRREYGIGQQQTVAASPAASQRAPAGPG